MAKQERGKLICGRCAHCLSSFSMSGARRIRVRDIVLQYVPDPDAAVFSLRSYRVRETHIPANIAVGVMYGRLEKNLFRARNPCTFVSAANLLAAALMRTCESRRG
jgi:hypothetical protein